MNDLGIRGGAAARGAAGRLLSLDRPSAALAAALAACRRHFIAAAWFSALLNLLFLVPMLYMLQIYDRVVPTGGTLTLLFLTLVLLFGLGTLALLDLVRSRLLMRAGVRLDRELAGLLLDTALAQRGKTLDAVGKQIMREFDTLRAALTGPAVLALFDAPWSPIYILVCFLIHPAIGLLVLAGGVFLAAIAWRNETSTAQPLRLAHEAAARAYASQEQVLAGAEVVRALGMRRAMVRRHLAEREAMAAMQAGANFNSGRHVTASKFLRLALQSLALGLGAWLAVHNQISVGAIFAASFLAGRALQPIEQLLSSWRTVTQARGAYATLNELLEARTLDQPQTRLPPPAGKVAVEQLSVLNAAGEGTLLAGIGFAAEPGEIVALVGPSGAGKSTLLRMLAGAGRPDRGTIRIDGANMLDWDPERLAQFIGYLPQEVGLFAGTVKENIARFAVAEPGGDPAEIDERVVGAARAARIHELILRLPRGYDSELGWAGRGLSAGQAQRVGLARAFYGDPPIVLLDEPNAHLDADGEGQLIETLKELRQRQALVIIAAHRMGILAAVDRIMVLRDGKVEALGPRDEVLARLRGGAGAAGQPPRPVRAGIVQ